MSLSSPSFPSDSRIATAAFDSPALLKNYRPSSTLSLPSSLFPSGATATATATIDSLEILKKEPSSTALSLCSRLFPSGTTVARKISVRLSPMVSVKRNDITSFYDTTRKKATVGYKDMNS